MIRPDLIKLGRCVFILGGFAFLFSPSYAQTVLTHADTELSQSSRDDTAGNAGWLHVTSGHGYQSLFAFDVSGIKGSVRAELQMQTIASAFRVSGEVSVAEVIAPWDENTVTWNTAPGIGRIVTTEMIPESAAGDVISFDVSSLVNDWISNPAQNYGLQLRPGAGSVNIAVRSRESKGGLFPARIVITAIPESPSGRVSVSKVGGDYSSVPDAADNAYDGDNWCGESGSLPCIIHVSADDHIIDRSIDARELTIAGHGRSATRLIAAADVGVVVRNTSPTKTRIEDLSIISNASEAGASIAAINGNFDIRRVEIVINGGGSSGVDATAIRGSVIDPLVRAGSVTVIDTDIVVGSYYHATGINAEVVEIHRSSIDTNGQGASGLHADTLDMSATTVMASGRSDGALGVSVSTANIRDAEISAYANGSGVAVRAGNRLRLVDSEVTGKGSGLELNTAENCDVYIDGSVIYGDEFESLEWRHESPGRCVLSVNTTVVHGYGLGASASTPGAGIVEVHGSQLGAPFPDAQSLNLNNVQGRIRSSTINSRISLSGQATVECDNVRNSNDELLDETCQ